MNDLMLELLSCDCHFVRCIKSNEQKHAFKIQPYIALLQMRSLGVLETVKVRKESYPIRYSYKTFFNKYGFIMKEIKMSIDLFEN